MERQKSKKLQTAAVLIPDISIRYLYLKSSEFKYLSKMGYAESTICQHINKANLFIKWLKTKNIKLREGKIYIPSDHSNKWKKGLIIIGAFIQVLIFCEGITYN